MTTSHATAPEAPPPDALMMQLLFSKMLFGSIASVARLGIADHLSDTPRDIEDIARDTATHAPSLYRVLRVLVSVGVFTEGPSRHFAINPVAQLLRSDHPRSMRDVAIMFSDPWQMTTPGPSPAKMLDIEMLVCTRGGKERTPVEFTELFDSAGLRLVSITPTRAPVCLIEACVAE